MTRGKVARATAERRRVKEEGKNEVEVVVDDMTTIWDWAILEGMLVAGKKEREEEGAG